MKSMIAVLLLALVATSMAGYLGLGYGGLGGLYGAGAYGGLYGAGVPVGRAVAYSTSVRHPGGFGLGLLGGYGGYGYGGYGYGGLGLGAYGYGGYGLGLGHGKIW
uniref:Glycine_rich-Lyc-4 n=1 Tax=Lychas buchari TaxID=1330406 RepID=T1DEL3_9SCOR